MPILPNLRVPQFPAARPRKQGIATRKNGEYSLRAVRGDGFGNVHENEEAGYRCLGVEGLPKTDSPLDPGPGLGDIVSLGSLVAKASQFL
jgi:hypothetical protein